MSIIIQSVTVHWNKDYRGGVGAAERNAVPESFELPLEVFAFSPSKSIIVHEVRCYSSDNFKIREKIYSVESSEIKVKGTIIKREKELLQVYFKYSDYDCGKPYRSKYNETGTLMPLEEKAFDLHEDEYGRIIFNGRYTDIDNGNWWYEKKVRNIIRTNKKDKDIFVKSNISKKYEQLAILK